MMTVSVLKNDRPQSSNRLRRHAVGAYWGLAVGDALGATVEFMTPGEIEAQHGRHGDLIGGGWLKLKPGDVTDDTEMSLALGAAILAEGGVKATPIAKAFSDWMSSKPVDIGNTVRRGLVAFRETGRAAMPESPDDEGNGACMRMLPVALSTLGAPWRRVRQSLHIQNHITHNAKLSDAASETIAHMIQAGIMNQVDKAGLMAIAEHLSLEHQAFDFSGRAEINPSGYIVHTMKAVFQALRDTDTFEACLIEVTNRGGDADTTGAIAGMIAGAFYGSDQIPDRWLLGLNDPVRDLCEDQAVRLLKLSPLAQRSDE